jgi:hypothetical protein
MLLFVKLIRGYQQYNFIQQQFPALLQFFASKKIYLQAGQPITKRTSIGILKNIEGSLKGALFYCLQKL